MEDPLHSLPLDAGQESMLDKRMALEKRYQKIEKIGEGQEFGARLFFGG